MDSGLKKKIKKNNDVYSSDQLYFLFNIKTIAVIIPVNIAFNKKISIVVFFPKKYKPTPSKTNKKVLFAVCIAIEASKPLVFQVTKP